MQYSCDGRLYGSGCEENKKEGRDQESIQSSTTPELSLVRLKPCCSGETSYNIEIPANDSFEHCIFIEEKLQIW